MEAEILSHLEEIKNMLGVIASILVCWGIVWFFHH